MSLVRLALLALGCSATSAHAGAMITLVREPSGPFYFPGHSVRVEVFAQLDASGPASIRLRLAQFDVSDSDAALTIVPAITHADTSSGDIAFWYFGSTPACVENCGDLHSIDGSIDTDNILKISYLGISEDSSRQIILSQTAPQLVGVLEVAMPDTTGLITLDLLNADETDQGLGAEIRGGFPVAGQETIWTAHDETITGGRYTFFVGVPEPATLTLLVFGAGAFAGRCKVR